MSLVFSDAFYVNVPDYCENTEEQLTSPANYKKQ